MFITFLRKHFWAIVALSLLFRLENLIVFANLNVDKAIQLAATYNFIHGNGILLSTVFTSDLSSIKYIPFSGWPPGFTFWITPITFFVSNLQTAAIIADCIFLILLYWGIYKLLKILFSENSKEYFALFCLLNMFSFSPIYYYTSTDRYALTFFVFSLYFFVKCISETKTNRQSSLFVAIFIFLAALTRFAYLPLALVIPGMLIVIGKIKKDKLLFQNGILSLVTAFALSVSLYAFQKVYYGNGTYLEQSKFAFHFENLLQFDPIFYKTFFFTDTFESKLAATSAVRISIRAIGLLFTFLVLAIFSQTLFSKLRTKSYDKYFYFDLVCFFSITTTIGMLVMLSIISPASKFQGNISWTYVEESRYYAPAITIIQIYIIRLVFSNESRLLKFTSKWLTFASILFSFCYFSFKHFKTYIKNEKDGTFLFDKRALLQLSTNLSPLQNIKNPALIASRDEMMRTYSIISGGVPISNYDSLLLPTTILPKNKTILIECSEVKSEQENEFIQKNSGTLLFKINNMDWYKIATP